jgi:hypothetical protein
MGEPARTDGLCIISTNARWSVCLWAVSLSVTVGIKVDIHGYYISLWFLNVFWKKTKYPPWTVWNPAVLWSFSTHPNWGLFLICDGGYQGWYSWLSYISVVLKRVLEKTKYPPRTVGNPAVLWSFSTHPNWGLFLILLIFKYPELNF